MTNENSTENINLLSIVPIIVMKKELTRHGQKNKNKLVMNLFNLKPMLHFNINLPNKY